MNEQERKKLFKKTFDTVADGYDSSALRFFPDSAEHLSTILKLKGDEHILDIATGTGNVAIRLAHDLPKGRVTAIDFSTGMLSHANKKIKAAHMGNINVMEMDMQAINFPDNHFDVAVSAFSIFFAADMEKQLGHISSKVKPGGRIVITNFFENSFSPLGDRFLSCLGKYNVEIFPLTWKQIDTEEKCISLFNSANLSGILSQTKENGYYLKDASDWWYIIWNGGFRGLVNQLSDNDLDRFKTEHLKEVQDLTTEQGIWLEMNILYTIGTKL